MNKITRYRDIPPYTRWGSYSVDVSWDYLERQLEFMAQAAPLELDPDFQRGHVWTDSQQTRYIEHVLRGGRSGLDILWNCAGWNKGPIVGPMLLVDGKQRIEAVRKFMRGEARAFGSFATEYTDRMRLIQNRFHFHINDLPTRAEVLQWYLDINSGGVVHTEAELERVRALLAAEGVAHAQ